MLNILHGAYYDKSGDPLRLSLPAGNSYFDQAQVWLTRPQPKRAIQHLCQVNWSPDPKRGGIHVRKKPMKYQAFWRQRLQIKQAKQETLEELARLNRGEPTMVNYVEIDRDYGFSDGGWCRTDCDDAFDVFNECWTRKHHRASQGVRVVVDDEDGSVTVYDGPKGAAQLNVRYREDTCRTTGEEHCLHLERKLCGAATCDRWGLTTIEDLVSFDHEAFWQQQLQRVYRVKPGKLGRLLRNKRNGTRRRSDSGIDRSYGHAFACACDTVQGLIDHLGSRLVMRALERIVVMEAEA
jgi:hypothetical protein